jgi:hypothetical protein
MNVVAYAYFFTLDFVVNVFYTILFASLWFLFISNPDSTPAVGGNIFENAKGVDPLHAHSPEAQVIPTPIPIPHASLFAETGADPGSAGAMFSSISITIFWLIKVYFIIIVFSYARSLVIQSHISTATFSLQSSIWGKAQRKMLSSNYWKEDDEEYKQTRLT